MHDSIRYSDNPLNALKLTPKQFEAKVHSWLKTALKKDGIKEFTIEQQGIVYGDGGEYAIDSLVRITCAAGANITILAECKRCERPVEREEMLALHAKLADVGAHKGMLFSTSGFQSGALKYAEAKGLASVTVARGSFVYMTKNFGGPYASAMERDEEIVGLIMSYNGGQILFRTFDDDMIDMLAEYLQELRQPG